jgi:hypothetical protein
MGTCIARRVGASIGVLGLVLWLVGCGSSKQTTPGGDQICEPGVSRCDGVLVKACSESGQQETVVQVCQASQICSGGVCLGAGSSPGGGGTMGGGTMGGEPACIANSKFCNEGAIWKCDASGSASTLIERCSGGLFCHAGDAGVSCAAQACSSGDALCEGNVATTCLNDGSGPKPGGTDCGDSKQACYQGKCRDIACIPSSKLCQHDDVYLCGQNGTETTLFADCQANEVCDADAGACRPRLCDPGKAVCDGTRAVTCNAFGSAWQADSQDCAEEGKLCSSGACKKQMCGPSTTFCQDGSVYNCDSTGTQATLSQTCNSQYEHCEAYNSGTYAYCRYNDCQAGQTLCSGNVIKTCNDDGSLPSTGTTCASDQYCENAECKDLDCTPGTYMCETGDVYYCNYNAAPQVVETCYDGTVCKAVGASGATCSPLACSPDASACIGNKIGTCAADGQSLASVSSDCTASSSICTADLKCATTTQDGIGVGENLETLYAGTLIANAVEVTSSRLLTDLQMYLVLPSPRELRWVIYELSGSTYVAKNDSVSSAIAGTGYVGISGLSYPLKAGKRYLFGVVISGGDSVDSLDTAPFSQAISFGTLLGRVSSSYWPSLDASNVNTAYLSQMKVASAAP